MAKDVKAKAAPAASQSAPVRRYKVTVKRPFTEGVMEFRPGPRYFISQTLYDTIKDKCATAEPVK